MTAIHYRPRRSAGEVEVDAAVAAAERRCDVLEARLDLLEGHISEVRHDAAAAGVFNERVLLAAQEPAREHRHTVRLAARAALARATLRSL